MAFDKFKWMSKMNAKERKILKKWTKRGYLTDVEKLQLLDYSIYPYSWHGRIGVKKALKKAIKLLKVYDMKNLSQK